MSGAVSLIPSLSSKSLLVLQYRRIRKYYEGRYGPLWAANRRYALDSYLASALR
jgi:hypothetical protein